MNKVFVSIKYQKMSMSGLSFDFASHLVKGYKIPVYQHLISIEYIYDLNYSRI